MFNTRLRVIVICMVAVMAMPAIANAQIIYSEDFYGYMPGTANGAGWSSTSYGNCNGAVNSDGADDFWFEMYYSPGGMGLTCVELMVGPVNVDGFDGIQVSAQWQSTTPAAPAFELEFEFSWTGPSAGTSLIVLDQAAIIANNSLETVSSGVVIPDDAIDVTLTVTSSQITDGSTINIDNILFAATAPVPSMTKWGMLVFVVLTGLFILYYLRRIRKVSYPDN